MINFLMFVLSTIGLANILVHGSILDHIKIRGKSLRKWMHYYDFTEALFSCYECTGFWAGLVCGLFFYWGSWWLIIPAGFIGSVVCQTFTDIMYLLRSKIDFEIGDTNDTETS